MFESASTCSAESRKHRTFWMRQIDAEEDNEPDARVVPAATVTGKIMVGGSDISARDVEVADIRSRVGMVFQKLNRFPDLSVTDNVAAALIRAGRRDKKEVHKTASESLESLSLRDEVKDKLIHPGANSQAASNSGSASPGVSK